MTATTHPSPECSSMQRLTLTRSFTAIILALKHSTWVKPMLSRVRSALIPVKKILDAAKDDPVLADATVVLASDHGHRGGHENSNPKRTWHPGAYDMDN